MEFLSVLIEVHNAFWFLFKPELVKLINQITCEENKYRSAKITYTISCRDLASPIVIQTLFNPLKQGLSHPGLQQAFGCCSDE